MTLFNFVMRIRDKYHNPKVSYDILCSSFEDVGGSNMSGDYCSGTESTRGRAALFKSSGGEQLVKHSLPNCVRTCLVSIRISHSINGWCGFLSFLCF